MRERSRAIAKESGKRGKASETGSSLAQTARTRTPSMKRRRSEEGEAVGATTRKAAPAAGESPNIFLTCSSDVLAALCSEPQPLGVRRKGSLSLEDFSEGLDSPPLLPMNASLASLEPVIEQLPPWSREKSQEYFFPLDGSRRPAPPPALSPEPVREPCVPKPCEPFSDSQSGLRVKSEPIAPSLPAFQAVAAEAGGYETGEAVQPEGAKGAEGAEAPSGAALAEPVVAASPHCAPTVASPRKACPLAFHPWPGRVSRVTRGQLR